MTQGVSMEPLIFLWPKRIFSDTDTLTLSTRIFRKVAPVQVAMNQTRECTQHNVPWFFLVVYIIYWVIPPPPGALTVQNWLWWLVGGGENRITQVFFSKEVVGSSVGPLHEAAADDDTIHQFQIRDPTCLSPGWNGDFFGYKNVSWGYNSRCLGNAQQSPALFSCRENPRKS